MPVVADQGGELDERWRRATSAYARTVAIYGSGTPEARAAWENAVEALDVLVRHSLLTDPTTVSH